MATDAQTVELIREALIVSLKIVAPILIAGVLVGLVVAIVQAATSIQEQTLTFVPKIVAMLIVAILLLPWIVTRLVDFTISMFTGW